VRFVSQIDVFLPTDLVERAPGLLERIKEIWAPVEARVQTGIEAATFVHELRGVLDALGIDNARSLVVDGVTVFHDTKSVEKDLPDLLTALADHVSVFGSRSQELRLGVEHVEAGLHLILEATVTSEHAPDAPSARIDVIGQLVELDPERGESAEAYRARIEPLVSDPKLGTTLRLQYGAFISRLDEALRRTLTDTRLEVRTEVQDAAAMPREEAPPPRRYGHPKSAAVDTASPARNFTISSETRLGAMLTGPPPYAVRMRKIEDIEEEVILALCECQRQGASSIPLAVARCIEQANRLIQDHNRYYPVEANLPVDPATGGLSEMGEPWRPRPALTVDELRREARERIAER